MRNPMPDGVLDLARLDCSASHRPGPAEAVHLLFGTGDANRQAVCPRETLRNELGFGNFFKAFKRTVTGGRRLRGTLQDPPCRGILFSSQD